ncbi:Pyridoxal deC domain containing protein [Trichuris trichiura]|uniref:Pyridoxal deC domain containing protein n=1 Tax=Trichuris trichiura TaxID=36087 RepID=A0A077Z7B3_TRITR|nr:Pyridoxal deC domain containing protein [Trichuris trichiura]
MADKIDDGWRLVDKAYELIRQMLTFDQQRSGPVIRFEQPEKLKELLDISLRTSPETFDHLVAICENAIRYSVHTGHPYFRNQLYGGVDPYGLAASFIIEALNTNLHTYEAAPVFVLTEMEVIAMIKSAIDLPDSEGTFCAGGSIANMYGLSIARHYYDNSTKQQGLFGRQRMIIFASAQAHYSVKKAAVFMGFGTESVVTVRCNRDGSMDIAALKESIAEVNKQSDRRPFCVWCTSGTTVLNGYDCLDEIAAICEHYGLWMHVDACLGGAALLSSKYRHLMNGYERCDSLTWNWHKTIGSPIQTSLFLTKHKGLLKSCHSQHASYLFPEERLYDTSFDIGDSSIQCSRKPDAFKIWLMWKAYGLEGLKSLVEKAFENAEYLAERLRANPKFKLVNNSNNGCSVCFWFIPSRLEGAPENDFFWQEVGKVNLALKLKMVTTGKAMIAIQKLPDQNLVDFFRVTFTCHPAMKFEEVDALIDTIARTAEDL